MTTTTEDTVMEEPNEKASPQMIGTQAEAKMIKRGIRQAMKNFALQGVYLYKCPFCRAWMDFPLEKCLSCGKPNSYY
jgi:hypothetical protein